MLRRDSHDAGKKHYAGASRSRNGGPAAKTSPRKPVMPLNSVIPKVGKPAPDFSLPDSHGSMVSLKSYLGKKVVLYFYPKDDTPGCTIEAKGFSEDLELFESNDAFVIGISMDTCESHRRFVEKHSLKIILLSDVDGTVVRKYGCWVQKSLYGRKYMGILRATFIIDERGIISNVFPQVSPKDHAYEVLRAIDNSKTRRL